MPSIKTNSGRRLNQEWSVGALHALYHKDGNWYEALEAFPGALFDPNGYIVFKTEAEYRLSPYLRHGKKLHVSGGIAQMPNYIQRPDKPK